MPRLQLGWLVTDARRVASRSMSSSPTQMAWPSTRFSSTRPSSSSQATALLPYLRNENARWIGVCTQCMWIGTLPSRSAVALARRRKLSVHACAQLGESSTRVSSDAKRPCRCANSAKYSSSMRLASTLTRGAAKAFRSGGSVSRKAAASSTSLSTFRTPGAKASRIPLRR